MRTLLPFSLAGKARAEPIIPAPMIVTVAIAISLHLAFFRDILRGTAAHRCLLYHKSAQLQYGKSNFYKVQSQKAERV